MTDHNPSENQVSETTRPVKAEQILPMKTVGIESLKEANPEAMSPHRRIFRWFARRPSAAIRIAVLASVLPPTVDNDELLDYMCIGPKYDLDVGVDDYVVQKYANKDDRDGSIEDHFGYDYPHKHTPTQSKLSELHDLLREHWGGSLPVVLDPTAGGGTIPLESFRYGLPTVSNELNPVAWLLNKTILEYAPRQGSLEDDLKEWTEKVEDYAEEELSEFFPNRNGTKPNHYFRAYSIDCPSCGKVIPISNRWWFNRPKNVAVKPTYEGEQLDFEVINGDTSDFNPDEGTVSGGDVECPHCGVVTERNDVVEIFQRGEFEYELCAVRYENEVDGAQYHAPTDADHRAIDKARKKVNSNIDLATLLTSDRYIGYYDRSEPYGIKQWRDLYSPRQLLTHATYKQAFKEIEPQIRNRYDSERAEALLVLLSFVPIKLIERNSRLQPLDVRRGAPNSMLGNNNFSFQWHFAETNLMAGTYSYKSESSNVITSYEETVEYVENSDPQNATVLQGDAADLSLESESVDTVVIDPPYGDNIMYAEIADAFYVWFREYLSGIFPKQFSATETEKQEEAVENPVIVDPPEGESTGEAARKRYEDKMSDIFDETYRVLSDGGVLTIYFTDKEISAWNSLTMSIIRSEYTITATHTITSEMPQRIGVRNDASADSTLLLVCRKPTSPESNTSTPTLWSDIRGQTRETARNKAAELLDSNLNLTKTDVIIGAFGPTLRVFTEAFPVVDKHDNPVRPKQALEEARTAVTEILIEREL